MGLLNWIQKKLNRKPDALAVSQKTETAMQVNEVTGEVNLSPQAQQDIGNLVVNALEQKNKALGDGTK